ncbi:hypothetical protein [Marisediminicola sp. LYQ85]|uniref:hypothetical protein n=1 Tax=Marisediminicola sp. LYQ85 TaxID=3391062 RepID=UPI003982EE5D
MKPPRYDDELAPLTSGSLIESRIAALIGRASRRQVWFLFVDEAARQLPILLPIDDHPARPDPDDAARFAALLREMGETTDAVGTIIVIERYADATLTASDVAWAKTLHTATGLASFGLCGILVSHSRGVRWVAPDDYLFEGDGASADQAEAV